MMVKRKVIVEQVGPGMQLYRREGIVDAVKGYFADKAAKKAKKPPRTTPDLSGIPASLRKAYTERQRRTVEADTGDKLF